jgi:kynureninase
MDFKNSAEEAIELDSLDELSDFRSAFHIPLHNGKPAIYLCGNSLGLQPKKTTELILQELEDWKNLGVEGHFQAKSPWFAYHEFLRDSTAKLVGARPHEVVVMNSLTANLHFLMVSFYTPDVKRNKIIFEKGPFSSDRYAIATQASFHAHRGGNQLFDPAKALVELSPREGEFTHRTEDIIQVIEECGDELAMVLIGGVNYYTGQLFEIKEITKAAHKVGAIAGFDLAHAAGNAQLFLHDWDVDFAAWCSYKYLNGGPGGVAGAFVHERHADNKDLPRFAGWWGNDPTTRFTMPLEFMPKFGADGWQVSNAPVLSMAALRASMELFDKAGMEKLREKSIKLTGYATYLINKINKECNGLNYINIITPENARGCQLSLVVSKNGNEIYKNLSANGVITDWRNPDVIRIAPVPLYNTFTDVYNFGELLKKAIYETSKTPVI